MIKEIQDEIINKLQGITSVKTVDVWQGDVEDLLKKPQNMPSLHIIYSGCEYEDKKVIGANIVPQNMSFLIILLNRNLKSRKEGSEDCYEIIESVRTLLIGTQIGSYGWLWPVKEQLLAAEAGNLAYGLEYKIRTMV
jgi:hypothetical protein